MTYLWEMEKLANTQSPYKSVYKPLLAAANMLEPGGDSFAVVKRFMDTIQGFTYIVCKHTSKEKAHTHIQE